MKACIFQTEAKGNLRSVSEEAILHILQDVKIAYPTSADSHWMAKDRFGKNGGTMRNGKTCARKIV